LIVDITNTSSLDGMIDFFSAAELAVKIVDPIERERAKRNVLRSAIFHAAMLNAMFHVNYVNETVLIRVIKDDSPDENAFETVLKIARLYDCNSRN